MKIGFLKDSEPRVSITPSTLEKYIALNHDIFIEKNAGIKSGCSDNDYVNAINSAQNSLDRLHFYNISTYYIQTFFIW